ncbi:hypothetical protein KI387_023176, partial [Taxus chinensis]
GCDGSVLLDDTPNFTGEKTAAPNANSLRRFDVIDNIKAQVERACRGVVSCADILTLAARDSVVQEGIITPMIPSGNNKIGVKKLLSKDRHTKVRIVRTASKWELAFNQHSVSFQLPYRELVLGGPTWPVTLGRRDSKTASLSGANSNLLAPSSNLTALISAFGAQGLSPRDMVALSGAHTIGQARCITFRGRAYNESNIDTAFATSLREKCPSRTGAGDNYLSPLDVATPNFFDNNYYKNLISQKGLLHSDQ